MAGFAGNGVDRGEIRMKQGWGVAVALFVFVGLTGCPEKDKSKGKKGDEMKVTAPGDTTIRQGETEKITVKAERKGFNDAIDVKFDDLPKGVKVKEKDTKLDKGETEATF